MADALKDAQLIQDGGLTDRRSIDEPEEVASSLAEGMGPIERANLVSALAGIGTRLSDLESRLKSEPAAVTFSSNFLEFCKIIFGGWPAFALILVIAFYHPLRDAISTIPESLKRTNEIGVFGVTFKIAIKDEAEKAGLTQLSNILPALAPSTVAYMMRGSDQFNSIENIIREKGKIAIIYFPTDSVLQSLEELEKNKLITIRINSNASSVRELRESIQKFKADHPAKNQAESPTWDYWELPTPIDISVPSLGWTFTELGKRAVGVLVNAVSAQLTAESAAPKTKH